MVTASIENLITKLRALYASEDEDYQSFFDHAAKKQKDLWVTDIASVRAMLVYKTQASAIEVVKEVQKAGAGYYRVGRRGSPTRIEWLYQMDSVGQVARGDHSNLIFSDEARNLIIDEASAETGLKKFDSTLSHTFRLRRTETVTFHLPADLSETEANRLADFVRSLPFDRD